MTPIRRITSPRATTSTAGGTTRRQFLARLGAGALAVGFIAACGEDEDTGAEATAETTPTGTITTSTATASATGTSEATGTPSAATRIVSNGLGETEIPAEPQRVIALGEEWMLADLLSLGVQPVASTASGPNGEFLGGVTELFDLAGVEAISNTEPDFERITALEPDLIITSTLVAEKLGEGLGLLQSIAPVVAVPVAGTDFRAEYEQLAAVFGKEATAEERLAEYDTALEEARTAVGEDVTASVITIFDASYIRVYVGPGAGVPGVLVELGVTLDPDETALPPTLSAMRAEISGEQLNVLTGDHVILLQSEAFDESGVVEAVAEFPGWQTLPAVQAGNVHVVDRFAHPGLPGRVKAVEDLSALLAP